MSSTASWLIWFVLDDLPRILRGISNRLRNRSTSKTADGEAILGLASSERDELARLRRENKQLRLERDILSKAAAWFARETGAVPSGSSGS